MYDFAIRQQEKSTGSKVTKIRAASYVGDNLNPMLETLIQSLSSKSGFVKPDEKLDTVQKFFDCCSQIYKQNFEKVKKAILSVPSYHIARKLGFELCDKEIELQVINRDQVHFNFDMCKK